MALKGHQPWHPPSLVAWSSRSPRAIVPEHFLIPTHRLPPEEAEAPWVCCSPSLPAMSDSNFIPKAVEIVKQAVSVLLPPCPSLRLRMPSQPDLVSSSLVAPCNQVIKDNAEEFEEALALYKRALGYFMTGVVVAGSGVSCAHGVSGLKYEKNDRSKEMIRMKMGYGEVMSLELCC